MTKKFVIKEERICEMCGVTFEGCSHARFCSDCKKKRNKESVAKWAADHRERRLQQLREYRARKKRHQEALCDYGEPPKIEEEHYFVGDEQRYCSGYDSTNLECIKCYENQIAEYKQCRVQNQKR